MHTNDIKIKIKRIQFIAYERDKLIFYVISHFQGKTLKHVSIFDETLNAAPSSSLIPQNVTAPT